jgi:Spy/CpxP family protein refolding chaperone
MKKATLVGLAAATLLAGSLDARGFHKRGYSHDSTSVSEVKIKRGHKGHGIFKFVSQLTDVSTEQTETIESIITDSRTAMKTLREEIKTSGAILDYISEDGLDRESFLEMEADIHSQMAEIKADSIESLLATLTPEQIVELQTLIQEEVDSLVEETTTEEETVEETTTTE